jgi:poly-gamma-glutamate capsule biosynthesis protein CapA/YwtB (metallophosphatase superfamily)
VQGVEIYAGKLIVYAHGNFIVDQMWSYETTIGVIGRYTFYDSELVEVQFVPVRIEDYARPVPLAGEEAQAVLDGMRQASLSLQELLAARQ